MNPAAPPAPAAASGQSAVGTKKKAHHGGTPAALVRGPAKGSAAFQLLLAARSARLAAPGAGAGPHAKETTAKTAAAANPEAADLKKALADLLKNQAAAHHPEEGPQDAAGLIASSKKHEDGKKTAAAKADTATPPVQLAALVRTEAPVLAAPAAKEAKGEPTDASKAPVAAAASAHRQEPLVRVIDLRRPQKSGSADASPHGKAEPAPAQLPDRDLSGGLVRDAGPRLQAADPSPRAAAAPPAGPQAPLDNLREMAGSELVRASTMVLRDGGGEIRLVLKPESLGSVRVRMNLVDNHIEGRIIVDSAAVKHVFDGSVDALRRALTAEGFQMGSLQVSVGGQDAQRDQGHREREPYEAVRRVAAQGFERSVPGAEDVSLGDLFVNLFV